MIFLSESNIPGFSFFKQHIIPFLIFISFFSMVARPACGIVSEKTRSGFKILTKTPPDQNGNATLAHPFHIKTIVIDAGHGGFDPGASGSFAKEKNITLAIAKKLRDLIRKNYPGIAVVMTRDHDVFVELDERALLAIRKRANLFISIHCNANDNHDVKGSETYAIGLHVNKENLEVAERENSAILLENNYKQRYGGFNPRLPESYILFSMVQSHTIRRSLRLAGFIEDSLDPHDARGVKQAGFLVLRKTNMPSILVETGFITNKKEEKVLASQDGQNLIAGKIFRGFEKYKNSVE